MANFLSMYKSLNRDNLHILKTVYTEDVRFIDPAHEINGLEHLTNYFSALYQNLDSIDFSFHHSSMIKNKGYVQWDMNFSHGKLAGGRTISVPGVTFLQFNDDNKVFYHRDYFDLGAMLYEHIPLLGRLVISIKKRLGK